MIRYTLRQMEYLVTCIDLGSLAAAAEALNVSQPTISVAIAKLENELGVQLLLRHHAQGVSPTPSAERLLQSARILLSQATGLQRQALMAGDSVAGELRLGSFATLAPAVLPGLIKGLGEAYPDIQMQIGEGPQNQLIEGLYSADYEMALLYDIDLPDDLRKVELAQAAPYVLLQEDHRLASASRVSLADLVDDPFILLDIEPSRQFFLGILEEAGLSTQVAFASPSIELVRGLVGRGLGFSLLVTRPHGDMTYDGQRLIVRPIKEKTQKSRIVLATLKALQATQIMSCFETYALSHFTKSKARSTKS